MNIFIIHSGKDHDRVQKQFVERLEEKSKAQVLSLGNGGPFWKFEARRKIKKAQLVLCAVGIESAKSKNIGWEISTAHRYRKCIFVIRLDKDAALPPALEVKDDFSNQFRSLGEAETTLEEVIGRIKRHEDGQYDVFNPALKNPGQSEVMEQYKLFLATSENLVARRQTVNNFYLTANAALISVLAAIGQMKNGNLSDLAWVVPLIGSIGIIICFSWRNLLEAYGTLNACKMKVINLIEKQLPLELYRAEWDVMSDKLNNRRYVSFTENEKRLPSVFILLYGLAITIVFAIALWRRVVVA